MARRRLAHAPHGARPRVRRRVAARGAQAASACAPTSAACRRTVPGRPVDPRPPRLAAPEPVLLRAGAVDGRVHVARGIGGELPLLCPGRLPALGAEVADGGRGGAAGGRRPSDRLDAGRLLGVPARAGDRHDRRGRWAAARSWTGRERVVRGAGAGVVFGVLVGVGCVGVVRRVIAGSRHARGLAPAPTLALGLVWGVVGGALGALLPCVRTVLGPVGPARRPARPPCSGSRAG